MISLGQGISTVQRQHRGLSPEKLIYVGLLPLSSLQLESRVQAEVIENPFLEDDYLSFQESGEYKKGSSAKGFEYQSAYNETLEDMLYSQLVFKDISEEDLLVAKSIIGNLDEDGYLRCSIATLYESLKQRFLKTTPQKISSILEIIQYLEPVSVGAQTLQERFMIQLKSRIREEKNNKKKQLIEKATLVIDVSFEDLTEKRYSKILKKHSLYQEELSEVLTLIKTLHPYPVSRYSTKVPNSPPDFFIEKDPFQNDITIRLNDLHTPVVRLSRSYLDIFSKQNPKSKEYEFIKKNYLRAKNLIDAIELRKRTLLAVMTSIAKRQRSFFLYSKHDVKPMILQDIATDTGLDISTVSRATTGKYVSCDLGVFALKYYFTSAIKTKMGESISSHDVKEKLREIVQNEGVNKLSDSTLTSLLKKEGYHISRRTVTKYREKMGIPIARLRKSILS